MSTTRGVKGRGGSRRGRIKKIKESREIMRGGEWEGRRDSRVKGHVVGCMVGVVW